MRFVTEPGTFRFSVGGASDTATQHVTVTRTVTSPSTGNETSSPPPRTSPNKRPLSPTRRGPLRQWPEAPNNDAPSQGREMIRIARYLDSPDVEPSGGDKRAPNGTKPAQSAEAVAECEAAVVRSANPRPNPVRRGWSSIRSVLLAALIATSALSCSSSTPNASVSSPTGSGTTLGSSLPANATMLPDSLTGRSEKHGVVFGTAIDPTILANETEYRDIAGAQFGMVTPENHMKWALIQPERNRYDFSGADTIVDFATHHGMAVHGHNLAWHVQNPTWLEQGRFTRDELVQILHDHIAVVAGRYKGRVALWDVANEAVEEDGTLRKTLWLNGIGPDYLDLAFRFAHEADPGAKLYYNDYGGEANGIKADAIFKLVTDMKTRGVPIDGVGFQSHLVVGLNLPPTDLAANMHRLRDKGFDVAVTEFDAALKDPATSELLEQQAKIYKDILGVCLAAPNCKSFTTWGFTDAHSWIPGYLKGFGTGLPWDGNYRPKPAYTAMIDALDNAPLR